MFVPIYRVIKYAFQDFWRNIWLSAVTVTIIVLALFSINFLVILNIITKTAISQVENKVDVSVYFKPEVTENIIFEIKTKLLTLDSVKDITYVSREEALKSFKEKHRNDPKIIESLEEIGQNPLGSTLIVQAKSTKDYGPILGVLNDAKYQDYIWEKDFQEHELIIDKISTISQRVKKIGLIMSIIFTLIGFMVVFNTIRVNIYTQRKEIGIMKLVGASNWLVRAPFLLEGIFYSIIGMVLTVAIIYPCLGFIQPYIGTFFETTQFNLISYFNLNFVYIFGIELLAIMFLNIISSFVATSKYLKV